METHSQSQLSSSPLPPRYQEVEDWEEWESEGIITPIEPAEQVLIEVPAAASSSNQARRSSISKSNRYSTAKLKRLKSRQRQKAQNAKAGITLITDMTALRKQAPANNQNRTPIGQPGKFVDAAALRALEGEPNSASVGNWNWLRRARGQTPISASPQNSARTADQELSPEDRPIVIGISLPSDVADSRQISPQTANVTTPSNPFNFSNNNPYAAPKFAGQASTTTSFASSQSRSVWSPDTPDTASSFNSPQRVTTRSPTVVSVAKHTVGYISPVSTLPAGHKKPQHQRLISLELGAVDDDDGGTPCTLFEEDGIPSPLRLAKSKAPAASPDSAGSRTQGWWDHVTTPFTDKRFTFSSQKHRLESPREEDEDDTPESSGSSGKRAISPTYRKPAPIMVQAPIVRAPTPRRTPSPQPAASSVAPSTQPASTQSSIVTQTKPQIIVTEEVACEDGPPPYSPPKKSQQGAPVRYRAVFPPGHPLYVQFPPSPGPVSPGLTAAMSSQGATQMAEIPLSPSTHATTTVSRETPLPLRPAGAYLPREHVREASGRANKVERQRRRHEKEEVIARRAGGFWRGRGCIPANGCFGRSGREGRKRRRVWIGVAGGILALITLVVVLAVVLTRPTPPQEIESIWVNLTDFPPMPTGALTVVAPDNSAARSSCTAPTTLWSCSLPKEQHESVAPFNADQPTIAMKIEWDNGTENAWRVPNGEPPESIQRRARSLTSLASSLVRNRRQIKAFEPVPSPPTFEEMWFLGETTDDIKSKEKAGEPTPFYLSLFDSSDEAVNSPTLGKRQNRIGNDSLPDLLPQPELEDDGTPKPARLLPRAKQQPVRLYDRGLPTEHYGFYVHYKRTIYVRSVTGNETDKDNVPLDENGGSRKTEARFLVTWAETRFLMRIWTRTLESNTSSLLAPDGGDAETEKQLIRPGTMPYPVTVTMDTHGGDPVKKLVWSWPMDVRQKLDVNNAKLLANNMNVGGTRINPRNGGDEKFGGFDGGTGGCKCEWVNWVQTRQ
ncbi:tRNA N6-adenosine threonylcarbamoyltransferase [Paramyrothecium foliicola]|nr:tRNA N6-adenosine threonylcarbamoyltransferase [Paramyrothecium foliicola]